MDGVYRVVLEPEERAELEGIAVRGKHNARTVKRAQVLLATDQAACRQDRPAVTDEQLAVVLGVGTSTIFRVRRRWVEHGHDGVMHDVGAWRQLTASPHRQKCLGQTQSRGASTHGSANEEQGHAEVQDEVEGQELA